MISKILELLFGAPEPKALSRPAPRPGNSIRKRLVDSAFIGGNIAIEMPIRKRRCSLGGIFDTPPRWSHKELDRQIRFVLRANINLDDQETAINAYYG
jgi:hypothetical protein